MLTIERAVFPAGIDEVLQLFREYAAELPFDLSFQGFEEELATLPGAYAPPRGCILLARGGRGAAGCVGLRPLGDDVCEMKRLYVRPKLRRRRLGRRLVLAVLGEARDIGYRRMRLDTVPSMARAIALYRALGFHEIAPYTHSPVAGALFFECRL